MIRKKVSIWFRNWKVNGFRISEGIDYWMVSPFALRSCSDILDSVVQIFVFLATADGVAASRVTAWPYGRVRLALDLISV